MPLQHTSTKAPGQPLFAVADWNANHVITGGVLDIGANNFIVDTNVLFVNVATNKVGIGTAAPGTKLHIDYGATSAAPLAIQHSGVADGDHSVLQYRDQGNSQTWAIHALNVVDATHTADFSIETRGGSKTDFVVKNGGKIGIGTGAPTDKLHIDAVGSTIISKFENDNAILQVVATADLISYIEGRNAADTGYQRVGLKTTAAGLTLIADTFGNVGIGMISPNQKLTIEGTQSLREQATANADTANYGQIWVKNTTPCELWFTDDAGNDIKIS